MSTSPAIAPPDTAAMDRARARQANLTKPPGSLGRLEELAVRMAGFQGSERPSADRVGIVVFAADHGVAARGVSAFPAEVTVQMIANFAAGGAAVSVLANRLGASLRVVDVGSATDYSVPEGVTLARAGRGTADFTVGPAMSAEALAAASASGRAAADEAVDAGAQVFVGGEMGIANTTAAAAVACALLDAEPTELAGPGTGLDAAGVSRKAAVIGEGLARHRDAINGPDDALRCLGGFEIVALAAAMERAAASGVPTLVDGFIVTVAALAAVRRTPSLAPWLIFAHTSDEPGHRAVLRALDADPLLALGLRLGEGSGAAAAVPLLRLACEVHGGMATFEEAAVAAGEG
ncbi:Nicotinate-nucleotide--dimethylbenzimidazole phosphoribosyltransferase [wastewater metagenome]|uniref:Nicotinate-nucleotide--dimethylbenzimidazole phosphoribosyltransferase n=2 Tax=unclassified sequences TaxID=12908 RepID=A0A5B8RC84_9ZZZZ|nr:nicotinate-nucleotide--dimethylbenzimidazole phosphoribosyltransferase [Arhodomonas sp. KWT]QEA05012.1 nicotinate-nucleotide--dimethylbenzimidazole phosphoribosyltransferase [uncultured organism]